MTHETPILVGTDEQLIAEGLLPASEIQTSPQTAQQNEDDMGLDQIEMVQEIITDEDIADAKTTNI